ncbi:hypothetical protein GGI04_000713 [Coemansia thaxteri]|uniref:glucan endo-1,3-beta-D-glucosidase n=1 Tax=Coemansia thaxteri TaxID=2663907 RepID=A0A9W8BI72_9FUNG|nr:hypothetical protein H4R26_000677 [Coemansia thaxteri]KAJ2009112.1 hypothetical protein GGI04_000713 [Coemansia thaxteri]KAJ2486928.1 hypothetical protein EV174_000828 [Coemansia sp. RSA 2320]
MYTSLQRIMVRLGAAILAFQQLNTVNGSPARLGGRHTVELWQATAEVTQAPAGVPEYYNKHLGRHPQPPSGIHVAAPKDRAAMNEELEGFADFTHEEVPQDMSRKSSIRAAVAPGYQSTVPVLQGVISALDPNQQSPLNTDQPSAFKAANSPYTPNGGLFDTGVIRTPLPTNKWWQNLVIEQGADPIHPYPYVVKCLANASTVGFPTFQASASAMTSNMAVDWQVGDSAGALTKRLVTGFDALGVTVKWSGKGQAGMTARFYKGLPFVTFEMAGVAPQLTTAHAILHVTPLGLTVNSYGAATAENATRLMRDIVEHPGMTQVALNDGSQWLVVSKPAVQWVQTGTGQLAPKAGTVFTGFVQLAHLGDNPAANLPVLQKYAGTYPTAGSVTYAKIQSSQAAGRTADIMYFYQTNTDGGQGADASHVYAPSAVPAGLQLLTLMLPHHVDLLVNASFVDPGLSGYRSAKGPLTAVAGNLITYCQPLDGAVSFEGLHAIGAGDRDAIRRQLAIDVNSAALNVTAPDPYFFGKGVAKIARLIQIAQEVDDAATAAALGARLVAYLGPWLTAHSNSDPLVYDATWGGIVSTAGLADASADFGQGRYNDHHFHYGYFLYAGAVLAKHNVTAFAPLREPLSQLLRDYANPSYADQLFPYMRHFDAFDGHSWAAGLFSFADGRNQESTGEAINAYYAAYLYATALGLQDTADFYEIVLNMEATSARRYWHPTLAQARAQYVAPFVHNAVGILWASKADYATFFGANPEYIYGIQMIPFTPATRLLLDAAWVTEAWCPPGGTCAGGMKPAAESAGSNGWAQFLYTALSVVDRATALANVAKCTPDDGNTLTNVLHWIATSGQQQTTA